MIKYIYIIIMLSISNILIAQNDKENLEILKKGSLVGIGAVLASDEGYVKIEEIVSGGPAEIDSRLKVGDRIIAVAQGNNDFEDIFNLSLEKVVGKLRGEKGTVVRLQVTSKGSKNPFQSKIIEIRRGEVNLKDTVVRSDLSKNISPSGQESLRGGGASVGGAINLQPPTPPKISKNIPSQKEIKVTSMGKTPIEAEKQAISDAVRQAVGGYIDAQTITQNEEVIKDKILSVSTGFVKKYDVVVPVRVVEGGLYQISIIAQVEVGQVAQALKENNLISGAIAGQNLWAESSTKVLNAQDAVAMLEAKLPEFLRSAAIISFLDKKGLPYNTTNPAITTENPADGSVELVWLASLSIDKKIYKTSIVPVLKQCFEAATGSKPESFSENSNELLEYDSPPDTGPRGYQKEISFKRKRASFFGYKHIYKSHLIVESISKQRDTIEGYFFPNPKFVIAWQESWPIKIKLSLHDSDDNLIASQSISLIDEDFSDWGDNTACRILRGYDYTGRNKSKPLFSAPTFNAKFNWYPGLVLLDNYVVMFKIKIPIDEIKNCKNVKCELIIPDVKLQVIIADKE